MPNHETNNVTIIGEPAKVKAFIAEAFIQPGDPVPGTEETNDRAIPVLMFELIVPQPENIEVGGCSGQHAENEVCWYTWNLEHWGTKWGAYNSDHHELRFFENVEGVYARLDLRFDTAWSQPTPIFAAIEERWGVKVHAVTQDEGGFPDTEYGDPYGEELFRKIITIDFESYDSIVPEPSPGEQLGDALVADAEARRAAEESS